MLSNIKSLIKDVVKSKSEIESNWSADLLENCKFMEDQLVSMDLGSKVKVFINHTTKEEEREVDDKVERVTIIEAYSITCPKPISYGKLINYAEKQEYDEMNLGEITAINRKGRQNPEDPEVLTHDEFLEWVKKGLNKVGYNDHA